MQDSKKRLLHFRYELRLYKDQSSKTSKEIDHMRQYSYTSAIRSLMYDILCTRVEICFVVGMVSRYQSNLGPEHCSNTYT